MAPSRHGSRTVFEMSDPNPRAAPLSYLFLNNCVCSCQYIPTHQQQALRCERPQRKSKRGSQSPFGRLWKGFPKGKPIGRVFPWRFSFGGSTPFSLRVQRKWGRKTILCATAKKVGLRSKYCEYADAGILRTFHIARKCAHVASFLYRKHMKKCSFRTVGNCIFCILSVETVLILSPPCDAE